MITMHYNDHNPAHFHARYGSARATIRLSDLQLLAGELPARALGLVRERAQSHREELEADWERARALQPLEPIAPLE